MTFDGTALYRRAREDMVDRAWTLSAEPCRLAVGR